MERYTLLVFEVILEKLYPWYCGLIAEKLGNLFHADTITSDLYTQLHWQNNWIYEVLNIYSVLCLVSTICPIVLTMYLNAVSFCLIQACRHHWTNRDCSVEFNYKVLNYVKSFIDLYEISVFGENDVDRCIYQPMLHSATLHTDAKLHRAVTVTEFYEDDDSTIFIKFRHCLKSYKWR